MWQESSLKNISLINMKDKVVVSVKAYKEDGSLLKQASVVLSDEATSHELLENFEDLMFFLGYRNSIEDLMK